MSADDRISWFQATERQRQRNWAAPCPRAALAAVVLSCPMLGAASARRRRCGQRGRGPPRPARELAPIDLTGTWVSVVTEDWRWRMVTPPKGDVDAPASR